ncbi:MAG: DUF3047 domain-containing protein [Methylococcaceae bacterium]
MVLKANSQAAGSELFKEQRIDLEKTPFINWLWRIVNCLSGLNEQSMSADDYAARIYLVVNGGWHFGKPRRLVKYLRQSRRLENMNRSKRVNFVPPKGGNALK